MYASGPTADTPNTIYIPALIGLNLGVAKIGWSENTVHNVHEMVMSPRKKSLAARSSLHAKAYMIGDIELPQIKILIPL